ncbi:cupin domain-containing protein [Kytococcus sp. Marseille-QA3725]
MTPPPAGPDPASRDRSALTRLLDTEPAEFAERSWGTRPLHMPRGARGGDDFTDLFSLEAVDELLTHRGLRTPFLRMARDGDTLPEARFTRGGGTGAGVSDQVDEDRVRSLFAAGATIVLQGLHRTWPPVADLARTLGDELGHPVQVNAYVTPPQNQGFTPHHDVHDVFVLQVHGTKQWTLHEPVIEHPLRDQPWDSVREQVAALAEQDEPLVDTVVEPGDVLYLPRGTIHAAQALGGISAHLTVGVHTWTPHHLVGGILEAARARLREDPALRANLPVGTRPDDAEAVDALLPDLRAALHEAVDALDAETLAHAFRDRVRTTRRPDPAPPLAQLAAAEALDGNTSVRLRGGLEATRDPDHSERLHTRLGWFDLDEEAHALLQAVGQGPRRVEDLPGGPAVARDLVRRGLLEVEP